MDATSSIFLLVLVGIIVIVSTRLKNGSRKIPVDYQYTARKTLMTKAETDFFYKLSRVAADKYYVFPQIHLSSILDHKVNGQKWRHAFNHINGKSVDYVLCDLNTLEPTYVVELDDYTHDRPARKNRDDEVNRILHYAGVPLLRVIHMDASDEDIVQGLIRSREALDEVKS